MPDHYFSGNEARLDNVLQGLRFDGNLIQTTWEKKMERLDKKSTEPVLTQTQPLDGVVPSPKRVSLEPGSPDSGMVLARGTRMNSLSDIQDILAPVDDNEASKKELTDARDHIQSLESQIVDLSKRLRLLQQKTEEQDQNLRRMAKTMATKTNKLQEVATELQSAQVELAKAAKNLQSKDEDIVKLKIEVAERDLTTNEALEKYKLQESKLRGERARIAKNRAQSGIEKSKQKASSVKSLASKNGRKPESPDVIKLKNKSSTLSKQIESMKLDQSRQLKEHEDGAKQTDGKHQEELQQTTETYQAELAQIQDRNESELKHLTEKHIEELREKDLLLEELRKKNSQEEKQQQFPVVSIPKSPDSSGFRSYINDKCAISKALFIGINYIGMGIGTGQLQGCGNDVHHEKTALQKMGFTVAPGINTRLLTDENQTSDLATLPTKANCLDSFKWLLADVQPGDVLWLHYSGHGVQDSTIPSPERDGVNEAIQPLDYITHGNIMDKVLRRELVDALPKGATLYAVMDCCHSGDILDMRYVYDEFTGKLESDSEIRQSQGDAILISGCMSSQESADLPSGALSEALGALTTKLCAILNDGADKKLLHTWAGLIQQLRMDLSSNQLSQIPQLESSRRCNMNGRSFKKAFPSLQTYKRTGKFGASDEKVPEAARSKKALLLANRTKQEERPTYESDDEELSEDMDEVDEYNALQELPVVKGLGQTLTPNLVF